MKKNKVRFNHWTCPFCGIIIPDYRRNYDSIETKVRNHLTKFHYEQENLKQLIVQLKEVYYNESKAENIR